MKRLLLVSAVVGLVTTMGTANATPVTTLDTLTIWNALTPRATITSASQQALPATNPLFTAADLISTPPNTAAGGINFSLPSGTPTVGAFLATDNPAHHQPLRCSVLGNDHKPGRFRADVAKEV
jgi:hypothetical protein